MSSTEAAARHDATTGTPDTRDDVATETSDIRDDAAIGPRDEAATKAGEIRDDERTDTRDAGSAAERLGGPSERDESPEIDSTAEADAAARTRTPDEARATLIPAERAESYNSRWNEIKGEFVDEPRGAVRRANEMVGEVLDELEELFRSQRADLEQGLDNEETTTEDLRQALGRYRSFFDRLLSF